MRVLYLSPTGRLGGAESSLVDVLASLKSAEPSWDLRLIAASDGLLIPLTRTLGVSAGTLPFPDAIARLGEHGSRGRLGRIELPVRAALASPAIRRYRDALARVITAVAPDVIHTNGLKMHVLGAMALGRSAPAERVTRPALVWHLHDYLSERAMTTCLLKWCCTRASAVVANSESVAADATRALGGVPRVLTVRNAVDLDRFSVGGACADLDGLAGLPPAPAGTVRVGLVATLARWKGHATFLEAIARLPGQLPLRAYIVGDAVYHTEGSQYTLDGLRRLARTLGVGDRVGFTGFARNPEAIFRALDVVVHASTSPEPFGLVIAEAMACGRAIVVSHAGGAAEIVSPGLDALVHAPGDSADLAARIATLVGDAGLRARLGRAARVTAERSFDRRRLAAELVPLYRSVVAADEAAPTAAHAVPAHGSTRC
jgi:glycosyltransferase involved in cell wall biosynthesis